MTTLTASLRLPLRIQSLVSLTSILIRLQPISLLHASNRPITSHCSRLLGYKNLITGGRRGANSPNCPIRLGDRSNHPISTRSASWYMCGNSHSSMASAVLVSPTATHTGTVIFLHGLGDTGHGWCAGFEEIREPHIKYIFPNAGIQPVTLNMGMAMPSWFDIHTLGFDGKQDEAGIKNASANLIKLIEEEEKAGIPSDRIMIGGFSQGGAVSLYSALTYAKPLAGVIALSTWIPLHKSFKADSPKKTFPLLQCHGGADPVVGFTIGEMTRIFLQKHVANPVFKKFDSMGHSSCQEEMLCVRKFIKESLP